MLVSFVLVAFAGHSLAVLVVGIVLLHFAIFPLNVLIATRLFSVVPEGRSRVNTALIVVNFVAGAIGSALTGVLWSAGGWTAVTVTGVAISAVGLAIWGIGRRGPLALPTSGRLISPINGL
jgi:predicted MFS family arabinose efflux permease